MLSNPRKALKHRSILTLLLLSAMGSSGCASLPRQATLTVPDVLREPCARADVGNLATVGDLGSLVIRQEAAVSSCDTKRAALVGLVDTYGQITKPKRRLWPFAIP